MERVPSFASQGKAEARWRRHRSLAAETADCECLAVKVCADSSGLEPKESAGRSPELQRGSAGAMWLVARLLGVQVCRQDVARRKIGNVLSEVCS